jgi:hypothetical protein
VPYLVLTHGALEQMRIFKLFTPQAGGGGTRLWVAPSPVSAYFPRRFTGMGGFFASPGIPPPRLKAAFALAFSWAFGAAL